MNIVFVGDPTRGDNLTLVCGESHLFLCLNVWALHGTVCGHICVDDPPDTESLNLLSKICSGGFGGFFNRARRWKESESPWPGDSQMSQAAHHPVPVLDEYGRVIGWVHR